MDTQHGTKAQVWGEDGTSESLASTASDRQLGSTGRIDGAGGSLRTDSKDRIERDPHSLYQFVTGGILDQMIKQASDHLAKMEACVKWYEDEREQAREALEHLQLLKTLLESQSSQSQLE